MQAIARGIRWPNNVLARLLIPVAELKSSIPVWVPARRPRVIGVLCYKGHTPSQPSMRRAAAGAAPLYSTRACYPARHPRSPTSAVAITTA